MKDKQPAAAPVLQRSLSIYTLVGALQSAVWFFCLSPLLKPIWTHFGGFTPETAELMVWLILIPYFFVYTLFVALPPYLLEWDFFEQFKISKEPWPWRDERQSVRQDFWKLTRKSIMYDFVNLVVFIPACVYLKTLLFPSRGVSFAIEEWPTYWESGVGVLSMILLHEFGFYTTHRIMHSHPALYQYHKVHHEYKQNDVLSAQHFHPVDLLFSIAIPAILPTIIVKPHSFTQVLVGLWIFTANLDDHLGYAFPW